jgi:hypothetical protein
MRRGRYVPAAPVLEWSLWPNEETAAQRTADRIAMTRWRAAASTLAGRERASVFGNLVARAGAGLLVGATGRGRQLARKSSRHHGARSRFPLHFARRSVEILRRHGVKWVLADDDASSFFPESNRGKRRLQAVSSGKFAIEICPFRVECIDSGTSGS